MRIDSHQHFWKHHTAEYPWMTDQMDVLRRDHLPEELQPKLEAIGFDGTVAVQARRSVAETEWLLDLSDRYSFIRGIVGWVDFESDQLDQQLRRYRAHPKLKGVREVIHDMEDIGYTTSDVHTRAIAKLARYRLTYDLLLKPPHICPATELVRRFPDQPFVVDHIAKPDIANRKISPWRENIQALGQFGNVYCKLSGMVTEAEWHAWQAEDFRPYLDVVLEAFGPRRLMIGSDWPVCTLSGDYEEVMSVVIDYVGRLSPDEREAILGLTAGAFYGLDAG